MTATLTEPGRWYVSFVCFLQPETLSTFGPFDSEREAADWLARQGLLRGGLAWCEGNSGGARPTVHDCGATADTVPADKLRRVARDAKGSPPE
jgi:hypothetical protein